jgi:hypothetical protein
LGDTVSNINNGSHCVIAGGFNHTIETGVSSTFIGAGENILATKSYCALSGYGTRGDVNGMRGHYFQSQNYGFGIAEFGLEAQTSGTTPAYMGVPPATVPEELPVNEGDIMTGTIEVFGFNSDLTVMPFFSKRFGIIRLPGGNATVVQNSVIGTDATAGGCTCTISANTTDQTLRITVVGRSGMNINWLARVTATRLNTSG